MGTVMFRIESKGNTIVAVCHMLYVLMKACEGELKMAAQSRACKGGTRGGSTPSSIARKAPGRGERSDPTGMARAQS